MLKTKNLCEDACFSLRFSMCLKCNSAFSLSKSIARPYTSLFGLCFSIIFRFLPIFKAFSISLERIVSFLPPPPLMKAPYHLSLLFLVKLDELISCKFLSVILHQLLQINIQTLILSQREKFINDMIYYSTNYAWKPSKPQSWMLSGHYLSQAEFRVLFVSPRPA